MTQDVGRHFEKMLILLWTNQEETQHWRCSIDESGGQTFLSSLPKALLRPMQSASLFINTITYFLAPFFWWKPPWWEHADPLLTMEMWTWQQMCSRQMGLFYRGVLVPWDGRGNSGLSRWPGNITGGREAEGDTGPKPKFPDRLWLVKVSPSHFTTVNSRSDWVTVI